MKVIVVFLAGLVTVVGTALATTGIGILSPTTHARGRLAEELNIHSPSGIKLKTHSSIDVAMQSLTVAPGGTTGWHGHPGPVLVTVKTGALTIYYADEHGCPGTTHRAGVTFVDPGDRIHTARNEGSEPAELWVTYLVPGAAGTAFRIDAPDPGTCPF